MGNLLVRSVILALVFGGAVRADDQADAKAILEQVIKAHGGEAALAKPVGFYFKVKGTIDGDMKTPVSFEWFFQGDDKQRTVAYDEDKKIVEIEVINGKEGWVKEGEQATEKLSDEQLASRREIIYLNWITMFVPLEGKEFRLSPLDEIDVGGRKAVGILVKHQKHDPVKLYFDKESHLLVEYRRKFKNVEANKDFDELCLFGDYRTVQDTKQPFKVEVSYDGAKVSELQVQEVKLFEKPLDDKLFSKP